MELNLPVPPLTVYVPNKFIRKDVKTGASEGCLVSVCSIPGNPLLFQVLFRDGALYERIPIHRILLDSVSEQYMSTYWGELRRQQIWDCPSYNITMTKYPMLQDTDVKMRGGIDGTYLWTFDWYGDDISEGVGDLGHKAAHLITDGIRLFAYPNDYCRFDIKAWVTPFDWANPPKYRRNNEKFSCE